jgi:hypothetical protein
MLAATTGERCANAAGLNFVMSRPGSAGQVICTGE